MSQNLTRLEEFRDRLNEWPNQPMATTVRKAVVELLAIEIERAKKFDPDWDIGKALAEAGGAETFSRKCDETDALLSDEPNAETLAAMAENPTTSYDNVEVMMEHLDSSPSQKSKHELHEPCPMCEDAGQRKERQRWIDAVRGRMFPDSKNDYDLHAGNVLRLILRDMGVTDD